MKSFMPNRKNGMFYISLVFIFIASSYCYAWNRAIYPDVAALLKARASKDPAISEKAYAEPSNLGKSDVPALFKELHNDDPAICAIAMHMLGSLGGEKKLGDMENDVIAALRNLLKSEHGSVRQGAALSLTMIDLHSFGKEMVPFLIEAIKEPLPEYELMAVSTFQDMGPDAKDAVPAIIEALKRRPKDYRPNYYYALTCIGTPEALEASKDYIRKRELVKQYANTEGALSTKRWLNLVIALGFVCLFWWSRRLRQTGKQIIYLPLLIPMAAWSLITIWSALYYHYDYVLIGAPSSDAPVPLFPIFHLKYYALLPKLLILATLAGIIPWLLSVWRQLRKNLATLNAPTDI